MSAAIKCNRCRRRMRREDGWNVVYDMGVVTGHLCPDCQTPDENAEAVINESTLDYSKMVTDSEGRAVTRSKTDE